MPSSVRQQFVSSSSAVRQQFVSSSSAFRQRFVSSSSAVRQQFVSSSSAVRQQFVSSSSAEMNLCNLFLCFWVFGPSAPVFLGLEAADKADKPIVGGFRQQFVSRIEFAQSILVFLGVGAYRCLYF